MSEQDRLIKVRIDKINQIRDEFGVNPYPYNYDRTHKTSEVHENYDKLNLEETIVSCAGRIMATRVMGKASFCKIQDGYGQIQLYIARDEIGVDSYKVFKKLDIGDFIGVKGVVKKTKTGETSIFATEVTLLSKNIRPLPIVKEKDGEVFDAFADKELRYRNRHVDLIVTNGVKETFEKRLKIIRTVRHILEGKEFYEVETPVLVPIYGGGNAQPFTTHHNALDMKLFMRIALEPYLKKLIVGGFERVFEIGKNFRNEGIDKTHNPEFTMLELYQSYADYEDMMALAEEIFEKASIEVNGNTDITNEEGETISLKAPFRRLKMTDAIKEYGGFDVLEMSDDELKEKITAKGGELKGDFNWGLAVNEIFELYCEEYLVQPTFITHQPVETTPLCKPDMEDPRFLQRFELFINRVEFANAYSESNDPVFQRKTLHEQSLRARFGDEVSPMDENFVQAIETAMPPTGGMGIGIDRLVMLITGQTSIRDILFFPTMKPEDM